MRIGINTLACMPGRSGGDARYVRELVRHLLEIDHTNQYFLFVAPWNEQWFPAGAKNLQRVMCAVPRSFVLRVLWEQTVLPLLAARLRLHIFHAPVNVAPLAVACPVILTMLEAEPFMFPMSIPFPLLIYWRVMRRSSALRARNVIAISENSRREIVRYMDLKPETVTVVPLGVDAARFESQSELGQEGLPFGIQPPYFFWTGRSYPRKNLVRLLEAFGIFATETNLPHRLVLAGVEGWGEGKVKQALAQLGDVRTKVTTVGHVSDETLQLLYHHADAFVFPSLHEAFGLPVLEAMASGTPVVTSTTTATADVAGDAAVLVDPTSVEDIARGMKEVGVDHGLRERLREKGLSRALAFSWRATAGQTLIVYDQMARSKEPPNLAVRRD